MLTQIFILSCCVYICFAANYDIIWDQNYCVDKDRYPISYELPHNSPCSLCVNDVITLRINSTSNIYENLYRVPNETAMMNCDATTNENANSVIAFNDKQEITIRSGGSEAALSFFLGATYYFISTSNGTQASAENDLNQPPNSCLQLAFTVLFDNNPSCGNYTANCNFSSVFTNHPSLLRCNLPTTTPTATDTSSTTASSPSTSAGQQMSTPGLVINFEIYIPSPLSTVIPICVLIGIIGILIIVIPLVCIPILILYARGIICNSKNADGVTQPPSRYRHGGSSLDALTKPQVEMEDLYFSPFGGHSEKAETDH